MLRTFVIAAVAFAISSAGSAINTSANAGGAGASAVKKGRYVASLRSVRHRRYAHRYSGDITEFSSSSAGRRHTSPGR